MKNKERLLCAAILRTVEREDVKPYHENTNDICKLELGYRHHDILQRFNKEVIKKPYAQGFYTSHGRFVGRHEAMYIAIKTGLVSKEKGWENPNTSFVDSMNNMILNVLNNKETNLYQERDNYFRNLGYKQLFSEDIY